jgi:uncharacterized protein (TIGR04141 family)
MDTENICEPQAQFSIYKIDFDAVKSVLHYKIEHDNNTESKTCIRIIADIKSKIVKKTHLHINVIQSQGFYGVVFKTSNFPEWKDLIKEFINDTKDINPDTDTDIFSNTNVSYILLYPNNNCIYAMTGGYGSHYISKLIEKNYGLHLIPKLISKDNPVVKKVLENNLIGNRATTQRANRNNTSIQIEQDLSSIYRELALQIDCSIANELDIFFSSDESTKKRVTIINTDALIIRRSFTIDELKTVVTKLNKLETSDDNFALNYFIQAKKNNFKDSELTNKLVKLFCEGKIEEFTLVGDNYEDYYFNSDYYEVLDSSATVFMKKPEPIELWHLFDELSSVKENLSNSYMLDVLKKWKIVSTNKEGMSSLYPLTIYDALQGSLEFGPLKTTCYLINGSWYVLDSTYSDILEKEFFELYDKKLSTAIDIKSNYGLVKQSSTEEKYNASFSKSTNIIIAHKTTKDNVEIADLIFYDGTTVYLMCNKSNFNGSGARDLCNQILLASEYLQQSLQRDRLTFLSDYYNKICSTNKIPTIPNMTQIEFNGLFEKRVCFIAGYLNGYSKNSESNYAKYLTLDLNKRLIGRGQSFIPLGIK